MVIMSDIFCYPEFSCYNGSVVYCVFVYFVIITFKIHFNLMSVIGVFVAAQILRWYR